MNCWFVGPFRHPRLLRRPRPLCHPLRRPRPCRLRWLPQICPPPPPLRCRRRPPPLPPRQPPPNPNESATPQNLESLSHPFMDKKILEKIIPNSRNLNQTSHQKRSSTR